MLAMGWVGGCLCDFMWGSCTFSLFHYVMFSLVFSFHSFSKILEDGNTFTITEKLYTYIYIFFI